MDHDCLEMHGIVPKHNAAQPWHVMRPSVADGRGADGGFCQGGRVYHQLRTYWFNAHGIFQPRGRRGRSEVQAEPHGAAAEAHLDEEQMARGVAMPRTLHTCITGQTVVSDRR